MREILLPYLDGNVFHVTDRKGYAGIKVLGKIKHNGNGELRPAFPQSPDCYGNLNDRVCLFDFRNFPGWDWGLATPETLLNPPNYNNNPIFLILSEKIYPELKLQSQEKKPITRTHVPYGLECWFPGDIDVNKFQITTVYCATIIQNLENNLGRRMEAAHKKLFNNLPKD